LPIKIVYNTFNKKLSRLGVTENKIDSKLKILIFIVNFANVSIGKHSIDSTISALEYSHITEVYTEMLKNKSKCLEKDELLDKIFGISEDSKREILSASLYAESFAKLIENYCHEQVHSISLTNTNKLFNYIIKLFLINYKSDRFYISAKENLLSRYDERVSFASVQCEYINEIHLLLKRMLPTKSGMLMVLINQLLIPLEA
jgi:hypothetical protein